LSLKQMSKLVRKGIRLPPHPHGCIGRTLLPPGILRSGCEIRRNLQEEDVLPSVLSLCSDKHLRTEISLC
jgi:hypothetical protein